MIYSRSQRYHDPQGKASRSGSRPCVRPAKQRRKAAERARAYRERHRAKQLHAADATLSVIGAATEYARPLAESSPAPESCFLERFSSPRIGTVRQPVAITQASLRL
jgi:hypothetical protein